MKKIEMEIYLQTGMVVRRTWDAHESIQRNRELALEAAKIYADKGYVHRFNGVTHYIYPAHAIAYILVSEIEVDDEV